MLSRQSNYQPTMNDHRRAPGHDQTAIAASTKSMNLEAKGLNQLLHVLDLVSHKPAHLLRCAAGYNVTVFGQLRDQLGSTGGNHEFPI
jgi:hypothetical protein